jgi:hypothetical protein
MLTAVLLAQLAVLLGHVLARDGLAIARWRRRLASWRPSCSSSDLRAARSLSRHSHKGPIERARQGPFACSVEKSLAL